MRGPLPLPWEAAGFTASPPNLTGPEVADIHYIWAI